MNIQSLKNQLTKFDKLIESYFFTTRGITEYPYFVHILSSQIIMKYQNADMAWMELKSILDNRFDEMNSKNDTILLLLEKWYFSAGVNIADETYEYVINQLVFNDFEFVKTWNFIDSQLVEYGPERFNQSCRSIHNAIDKTTDEMLG